MKHLFAFAGSFCLWSCASLTNSEDLALKNRVAVLEAKVDSLTAILDSKRTVSEERDTRNNYISPRPPTKIHAYSGQCQAITRKGYQCSRRARSGGYCWQHGG